MQPLRDAASMQRNAGVADEIATMRSYPRPSPRDDEDALLTRWRLGSPEAGLLLLRRQVAPTRRYFSRKVPCAADVEDLVQRTLLTSLEALPRFRGDTTFSGFVHAVASKLLLRYRRDARRTRDRLDENVHPDAVAGSDPPATTCMSHEDTCDRLRRAFRELPDASARLLHQRYWDEQGTEEIGRMLGLSPGAVRARLRRARQEMKRALATKASSRSDVWPLVDI